MDMGSDTNWHLDKRIPVAIITAILVQTGGALWWAASISSRVDMLERASIAAAPQTERIIRVETKVDAMHEDVNEIKRALSRALPILPRESILPH